MNHQLNVSPAPRKPRRALKMLLAAGLLVLVLLGALAGLAVWRGNALLTRLAAPMLADLGVPDGRVEVGGLSLQGGRVAVYADAETRPVLALTLPFSSLQQGTYTLPELELWPGNLPTKGGEAPADWQAALRAPLSLAPLPWRALKVTHWRFHLPALTLDGKAELQLAAGGAYNVSLESEPFAYPQGPLQLTGLSLKASGQAGLPEPVWDATLTGTASAAGQPPASFSLTASYPGDKTFPLRLKGQAEGSGALTLAGGLDPLTLKCDLALALANGALEREGLKVRGLAGRVRLLRLWPLATASQNTLSAAAIAAGLDLSNVNLTFALKGEALNVSAASASLLGGRVTLAPATFRLGANRLDATLQAEGLDLAAVLSLAAVEGLAGDGRLSGSIPVTLEGTKLTLHKARLTTAAPGNVAYAPAEKPAFMAEGGQGALLANVFSDFRYQQIAVGLDGTLGENLSLTARLEGQNPNFYSGHPVAFNLNLTGALDSVLRQGLDTANLTAGGLSDLVKMEGKPQ